MKDVLQKTVESSSNAIYIGSRKENFMNKKHRTKGGIYNADNAETIREVV